MIRLKRTGMGFISQKQNKCLFFFALIPLMILLLEINTTDAEGAIVTYDRDIDISMGTYNYFYNKYDREADEGSLPDIKTGIYFGAYISSKSRLFTFFFNTRNIYSIYEAGFALNRIGNEKHYILSIPFTYDLAYKIPLFKKAALYPFAGTGFDLIRVMDNEKVHWELHYLLESGLEVKYLIWKDTFLKLRVSYGIMFVNQIESGFMHFLKVRFPVPFIP